MRVSAALIVRNEEAHLGACLACVTPIVDEIIVVDTGSTDRSPDIALENGAMLVREPWRDDFSRARNVALAHATGEWILYIDADERVRLNGSLESVLRDPNIVAARVRFRASSQLTPYAEHRVFRNRPDIRFRGVIHETVVPDLQAVIEKEGAIVVDAPLSVEHLGYEGDLHAKHRRNLPLLRRAVEEEPERIFLWHALGEAERGLNDADSAQHSWRRALAYLRGRAPRPLDALIYADLMDLHFSENALPDIDQLVAEASIRHADDPLVLWWSARHLAATADFEHARAKLERLLDFGADGSPEGVSGYDTRLFGEFGWALMGVCWLNEGNPDRAVEWLSRAEEANPDNLEVRTKRELAEGMAGSGLA